MQGSSDYRIASIISFEGITFCGKTTNFHGTAVFCAIRAYKCLRYIFIHEKVYTVYINYMRYSFHVCVCIWKKYFTSVQGVTDGGGHEVVDTVTVETVTVKTSAEEQPTPVENELSADELSTDEEEHVPRRYISNSIV